MTIVGAVLAFRAKAGHGEDVARLLVDALPFVEDEPGTVTCRQTLIFPQAVPREVTFFTAETNFNIGGYRRPRRLARLLDILTESEKCNV